MTGADRGGRPAATLELLHEGEAVLVQGHDVVVGRTAKCTVRVVHPLVSREHCRLEVRADGLWVTDLGSANGTWVDGLRLDAPTRIRAGAHVRLGREGASLEVSRATLAGIDVTRLVRQEDLKTMVAGDPRAAGAVARVEVAPDAVPAAEVPTRAAGVLRPSAALLEPPPDSIPVMAALEPSACGTPTAPPTMSPVTTPVAPPRTFAKGFALGFALGLVFIAALATFTNSLDFVRPRAAAGAPR